LIGLGAGAAVLALGMNVGGVFGKLYSELGEAVDPQPVRDLERMGVGRVGIFLYGILPQVKRQWTAYALFRLECSVRSASILGIVGAGGLGSEIALSIRYFQFDKLATTLLVVFVYIFLLEILAAKLRKSEAKFTLSLAGIGTAAGLVYLDIPWGELFENGNDFMVSLSSWPGPEQLLNAVGLTLQTVSMAWAATGLAAIVAFVLAPIATINFGAKTNIGSGRGQVFHTWGYWALYGISRGLLLFFRAIPELTMALIFVFWVGPGAFAGLLAIALHTVGVLGRLYCDTYEDIAPDPVAALEKLGTKPFGLWLYGIWPQAAGRILAYTLYRFEVNIRVSATMGFVGAGGIGFALHKAISLFHTADLILLLAVMVGVVVIFDFVGDHLRRKILMPANHEDRRPRVLVGGLREEPVLN